MDSNKPRIEALFFDMGGVILRTESKQPRQKLGEKYGMTYEEIDEFVFTCEASKKASIGTIKEEQLWEDVANRLGISASEVDFFHEEFFAGDVIDQRIIDLLRSSQGKYRTGLISNAWSGLRRWMQDQGITDAFESLVFSAEKGVAKPRPEIYHIAMAELNVRPENSIFVDDMPANIDAANALGMHGILFTDQESLFQHLEELLDRPYTASDKR